MLKSFRGYNSFLRKEEDDSNLSLNQKLKKYREEKSTTLK
jgi:hypothetical protein